jgi:SAM-dependent methyltransferase
MARRAGPPSWIGGAPARDVPAIQPKVTHMSESNGALSALARLEAWYRSPLGAEVAARESAAIAGMLGDVFGYYLVQVGVVDGFREALAGSRVRNHVFVRPALAEETSGGVASRGILAHPGALPVVSDGVDAVFLPHTLDFVPDPRTVLREAERVLIPEGRVLILGFNALSSWGALSLLSGPWGRVPWCGRFLTRYRIEDWLSLLGFDVEMRQHIIFRPPLRRALGPRLAPLDTLGRTLWPALGGVYVIRAVKRVSTLTPIRPSWSTRASVLPGAIEPTARRGLPSDTGGGRIAARTAGSARG